MDDYDYEKIDKEIERKTSEELGYVWEYDRWIEPKYDDIEIAKVQRFIEIANFGNEDDELLLPDWNPVIELLDSRPPQFEWVCIGEYNGVDIPDIQIGGFHTGFDDVGSLMIIESDYKVWQLLPNPEYDCKVTIS